MFDDYVANDFTINFPSVNFSYITDSTDSIPKNEEIWYNYLIVYEGGEHCGGRELESYNHIITFEDINKVEEKMERDWYREYGTSETIIVTNVVLLSVGKRDDTDD